MWRMLNKIKSDENCMLCMLVIACCMLQLKEANYAAIFLHTNDIVLKNKALSIGLKLLKLQN